MAWTKTNPNATKHTCNDGYGPNFGRKTAGCPRCDELIAGSAPRTGWGMSEADKARERRYNQQLMECKGPAHIRETNPGGYCITCGAGRDFS